MSTHTAQQRLQQALTRLQQHAPAPTSHCSPQPAAALPLPGLRATVRAIPNYIARSGLFAPVRRGWRSYHDDTTFLAGQHILLKGTGKQLTEDHADIWMHAMYLQTQTPAGHHPGIKRADFLRALGRPSGGSAYEWLHQGMRDLAQFCIRIEARRSNGSIKYSCGHHPATRVLPMIGGFDYADGRYLLYIDPRWAQIFANREYTLVDWHKRLQMRHELSKSLQRLIGTSADRQQRYSLQILKTRAMYNGPMHKFKAVLKRALQELETLDIIAAPRIEVAVQGHEQAVWLRLER